VYRAVFQAGELDQSQPVTVLYQNGDLYQGLLQRIHRHCDKGRLQYANGDLYEGGWSDGKREGIGCLKTARGVYNGVFANGFMATGTFTDLKGSVYSSGEGGRFTQEGLLNGPGKIAFGNGDTFSGNFRDGKRSGPGIMVYLMAGSGVGGEHGGRYEGQWKRDLREGQGRM